MTIRRLPGRRDGPVSKTRRVLRRRHWKASTHNDKGSLLSTQATSSNLIQAEAQSQDEIVLAVFRTAFVSLADISDLELLYRNASGTISGLFRLAMNEGTDPAGRFKLDDSGAAELLLYYPDSNGLVRKLLEISIHSVLERLAMERHQSLLLDELDTNSESLEVIYKISADVLQYGNVKEPLQRLLKRFASLQKNLETGLFLTR